MHDFGEGMIRFVIKNDDIAFALISPKFWIEACLLNSRIDSFYDLANKPSPNFSDEKIRQKGNYSTHQRGRQNFGLLNIYLLLIGDKVPEKTFTLPFF
jgi:hypothetical protein